MWNVVLHQFQCSKPFSEPTCVYLWGLLKEFPKEFSKCFTATKQMDENKGIEGQFMLKHSSQPFHPLSFQSNMGAGEIHRTTKLINYSPQYHHGTFYSFAFKWHVNKIYVIALKTLGTIIKGKLVCIHFLKFVKGWRTRISTQWSLLQMLPLCNFFKNRLLYFWQLFKMITKALNEALQH